MSLVNQVLRDLDKESSSQKHFLSMQAVDVEPQNLVIPLLIIALSLAVFVGAVWMKYSSVADEILEPPMISDTRNQKSAQGENSDDTTQTDNSHNRVHTKKHVKKDELISESETPKKNIEASSNNRTTLKSNVVDSSSKENIMSIDKPAVQVTASDKDSTNTPVQTVREDSIHNEVDDARFNNNKVKQVSRETSLKRALEAIINNQKNTGIDETIIQLDKLLKRDPEFTIAREKLIQIAWKHNHPKLPQILESAVIYFPDRENYRIATAQYYLKQNNAEAATKILEGISTNTASIEILRLRGLVFQKFGRHQDALNDYRTILSRFPNDSQTLLASAISLEHTGNLNAAIDNYVSAIKTGQLNIKQVTFAKQKVQSLRG
ncbi:lipopolysaccharide assembly protein LapB [Aliikangiella sp. G2MR2-5]|uniref:tetratricopeptide repeat protein n=1 Tax=Aliikangiella sp. G2MR2-5 TaxID=2788943 RepID=UPI0018A98370|nr:hypothetical protein [Aliikangiella sp. G2MR2-5]